MYLIYIGWFGWNRKTFIPAWKSTTSFWRSQHPLDIYPYFQVCSISNYNNIYINNDTENTRNKESWDSSPSEFLPRDDRCRSYFLSSFLSDWLHRHIVIARHLKLVNHTPTFLLPEVAIEGEGAPRNTQQRFIGHRTVAGSAVIDEFRDHGLLKDHVTIRRYYTRGWSDDHLSWNAAEMWLGCFDTMWLSTLGSPVRDAII